MFSCKFRFHFSTVLTNTDSYANIVYPDETARNRIYAVCHYVFNLGP